MTTTQTLPLPSNPTRGTYVDIWNALKKNTQKTVTVKCPLWQMETLIQAVKKIKSTENANRKRLDDPKLPHWGRLVCERDIKNKLVRFSLTYALEDLV